MPPADQVTWTCSRCGFVEVGPAFVVESVPESERCPNCPPGRAERSEVASRPGPQGRDDNSSRDCR